MIYEVFFSATGRTKKVAEILDQAWGGTITQIDLSDPDVVNHIPTFSAEDILLVTVSVYEGRVPVPAAERLRKFRGNGAAAILTAVYGGRAIDDCLRELEDLLTAAGFCCRAAIEAVAEHSILHYAEGRPNKSDQQVLADFVRKIQAGLSAGILPEKVAVPGHFPYKTLNITAHFHVKADERCVRCGKCAAACPVGAISKSNPAVTDHTKCITCMRCINICPTHARDFPPAMIHTVKFLMKPFFAGRRENRLYLSPDNSHQG